jgi:replicative DNA helicase
MADRLPPQNLDAEQSVLGSLLIDRDAIIQIAPILKPDDFYQPSHGTIYNAINELYARQEPTDVITLTDELRRHDQLDAVGGVTYLTSLVSMVPTAVHVEYYARIVERTATLRKLIDAGTKVVGIGFRENIDADAAIDEAQQAIFEVTQDRPDKGFIPIGTVLEELFDTITDSGGRVIGVPTGFSQLDRLLGGMQRTDLIVIAARPSIGKSALALSIAYNASVLHRRSVGVITLEMSASQIVQRVLAAETGINSHKLKLGQVNEEEWAHLSRAFGKLSEAKFYIDDGGASTVMDVRTKARRLQAEHGLDLLIIDYLQLMSSRRSDNRVQEISEISRGLKQLARELNIPVVALSQLSRAVEQRSDHRPLLSDLRESGSIEQDADVVMLMYRDEKYNPSTERKGVTELIVAKHRNGGTDTIHLRFFEQTTRFADLEAYREEPTS